MFRGIAAHGITWFNAGRVKENWKPIATIFGEIKAAGYDGVEHDKRIPTDSSPHELKKIAADEGLDWVGHAVAPPDDPADEAAWDAFRKELDVALELGVSMASTGAGGRPKTPEERKSKLERTAVSLEKAAGLCRERGLSLAVHNHWGQLLENREEIADLLRLAPSASLLFDTAHLELCGGGVLDVIARYPEQIAHVHLKDLDTAEPLVVDERLGQPRQWPHFKELGAGGLDFASILSALTRVGYSEWISVELDWADRDPLEAHKANRAHLRKLGY